MGLDVDRMEDLILVTGRTLVSSWAAVTFVDRAQEAQISLTVHTLPNCGTGFVWSKVYGAVAYHHSWVDPVCPFASFTCHALTFLLSSSKEQSIPYNEPMCLHQGHPSKAPLFPDNTRPGSSRTTS
jgi:hypothetical protein